MKTSVSRTGLGAEERKARRASALNGNALGGLAERDRRLSPYQEIKDAILTGVLRPMERITEARVAERLGLSRTPIREAFGRLAAEGLIVVLPQRGSFVSQLSLDHILEIYQIRMPLECMAARIAAETIEDAQLEELARIVETEAGRDATRRAAESLSVSARFHEIIVSCTRNRRLAALLIDLQSQVHRARILWPSTLGRLSDTWREHEEIIAALRARDADETERLMRKHLERARASTMERMLPVTR